MIAPSSAEQRRGSRGCAKFASTHVNSGRSGAARGLSA
jgi:hypothetical protein